MQITEWQMYWLLKLDDIVGVLKFCTVASGLLSLAGLFILYTCLAELSVRIDSESAKKLLGKSKRCLLVTVSLFILFGLSATFMPTTKQLVAIKVIPQLANSQFVQEDLPADVREVYEATKRKFLEMAGPEKSEEK